MCQRKGMVRLNKCLYLKKSQYIFNLYGMGINGLTSQLEKTDYCHGYCAV